MEFVLNGVRHSLEPDDVRSALRGGAPDDVREHWVEIDGVRWPPKQALSLATGIDRTEFTSHMALRQLQRLGFPTSAWGRGSAKRGADSAMGADSAPREERCGAEAATETDVVLVGCTRSKAPAARPAAELFTGARFTKARELAIRSRKPWYVLSAKFGLLAPDELVAPYDVYLPDQSLEYRDAWGRWVTAQLAARHELRGAVVEVHAGQAYCEPLRRPFEEAGAVLRLPLAGLRQGEQLAYYDRASHRAVVPQEPAATTVPDVSYLLDEGNAAVPDDFLSRGRAATDAPGLYSWWVDQAGAQALSAGLGHHVAQGLIYAGRAGGQRPSGKVSTNTLWGRVGGMHLGGNRNFSTFRLTLTAALRDSGAAVDDEAALTGWMHEHLRVAVLPLPAAVVLATEERLLGLSDPPLNLQGVPPTPLRRTLSRLRSEISAGS